MSRRKNNPNIPAKNVFCLFLAFAAIVTLCFIIFGKAEDKPAEEIPSGTSFILNEMMLSNPSAVKAPDGMFYDYIEVRNVTNESASLTGWSLLAPDGKTVYPFPAGTTLEAGGTLVVWAGGKSADGLYTGFSLSKEGGQTVTLRDAAGHTADKADTVSSEAGSVMIRLDDGSWGISTTPTPGFANDADGRALYEATLYADAEQGIVISEIMADNTTMMPDESGNFYDLIELCNVSDHAISLKHYTVSDDKADLYAFTLPDVTLEPGKCLLLYASGRDTVTDGAIHTGFKLNAYGETVFVCDAAGRVCDSVTYPELQAGQSYARTENGFFTTYFPTPGFTNDDAGREALGKAVDETAGALIINEAMSKNLSYLPLNGGRHYDWAELKNVLGESLSLAGYTLSDDPDDLTKWALPEKKLKSGETIVFVCSGEENLTTSSYTHTNFKINGNETLYLAKDGILVDCLCLKGTPTDTSMGRLDGQSGFFCLPKPTPGKDNNASGAARTALSEPVFDTAAGVYDGVDTVNVRLSGEGDIYYCLYYGEDGGKVSSRTETVRYDRDKGINLRSSAVVRAYASENGKITSGIAAQSYIINENDSLPVCCITLGYDDMWSDEKGIYVKGPNASDVEPYKGANYWQDWEKEGTIEFFPDGDEKGFSVGCGIKIFGAYSRFRDKKSFLIKFRDLYGAGELNYDLFGNDVCSFESLVLRSGSQDDNKAMVRDEWLTALSASGSENIYVQAYRPMVLYVNGAYWGVYYFREKVSDDYVSKHLNVPVETVNLLEANSRTVTGTNAAYKDLLSYVKTHDMTKKENYEYVAARMDIDSYIDYKIAEFFSGNQDTGNIKFFMSEAGDGKWHWILYDLDWAFYYYTPLSFYMTKVRSGFAELNTLSTYLLKNATFKDRFLKRMAYQLETTYSYDNAVGQLDALVKLIEPDMKRNLDRWGGSYTRWTGYLQELRDDIPVKLAMVKNRNNSYEWSMYYAIKHDLNLSDAEFRSYFGNKL